jgi:hypothetical protein
MHFPSIAETNSFNREPRISPDAIMKIFLRLDTPDGPCTVIAPNVPLLLVTKIAAAMSRAGLHAEYVEQYDSLTIAERLELKKHDKKDGGVRTQGNVIAIAVGA